MSTKSSYRHPSYKVMIGLLIAFLFFVDLLPVSAHEAADGSTHAHPAGVNAPGATVHPPAPPLAEPAPLREDFGDHFSLCDTERCSGTAPAPQVTAASLTLVNRRTRGSNSQLVIPQNLLLADVDADGASDFIQYASNKLFASKTNFEKTGILHLYMHRPIKRILTGDFHGDRYDQVCIVTDDYAFVCYGISNDRRELWWWFTQGAFFDDNEDTIVGDFDGDGRDDVLVYPRAGGPFRMYSIKGDYFFDPTPSFDQGNLSGVNQPGMQVRSGDFSGEGRDDLMVVNPFGQIISYASVHDGVHNTFWWAFTTAGGLVGIDDQVTVARIDDNSIDDVVLRNRISGATRFFRLEWADGLLPAITNIPTGQMAILDNSLLFWGFMHGNLAEPGALYREDAMVYVFNWDMFVRTDARWDGSNLTYWWAYTQHSPNNHTGWAPFTAKPWLMLKCQFADVVDQPGNDQFYKDMMASLANYWKDVSYGSWDLSGSTVIDAWQPLSLTTAQWPSRWDLVGHCMDTFGGSTAGYVNVIGIVNVEGDEGNHGGRVLSTPSSTNLTFLAHEMGHTFGWGHSFDDTQRKNADWAAPGEYFDHWDVMSAMSVHLFSHPQGVVAGPEMNAPYKTYQSFIPQHRILRLTREAILSGVRFNLAALNRPEADGPLMVRVGNDDNNYYTIEYRMQSGWDQGIPQATVLVHWVDRGISKLVTVGGGPERLPGSATSFWLEGQWFTVRVHNFASEGYTADITVDATVNASADPNNQAKIYLPFIQK